MKLSEIGVNVPAYPPEISISTISTKDLNYNDTLQGTFVLCKSGIC